MATKPRQSKRSGGAKGNTPRIAAVPAKADTVRRGPTARVVQRMPRVEPGGGAPMLGGTGVGMQYFEAAETNRLNEARWAFAGDCDINAYLQQSLARIRGRCRYEARNNAFARGVMETYAGHVVGHDGPGLQIKCDENPAFAEELEQAYDGLMSTCDASGIQSLPEMVQMWVRNLWTDGEFLLQTYLTQDGVIINDLDPNRLTALGQKPEGANHVILGVERTPLGRPVAYHIAKQQSLDYGQVLTGEVERIDARFIIHGFQQTHPNQARGIPWFSPALEEMSSLREYERYVLETAKCAARIGGVMVAPNAQDVADYEAPTVMSIEPGEHVTMQPGWDWKQINAEQPTVMYDKFVAERRRAIARVKNMPLMLIQLDAGEHNMASARFDGRIYETGVKADQSWLKRTVFDRVIQLLAVWVCVYGNFRKYQGQVPKFRAVWTFQAIPTTDEYKDAMAAHQRIADGISSKRREAAKLGSDLDEIDLERKAEIEKAKSDGVPAGAGYSEGAGTPNPALVADEGTANGKANSKTKAA